MNIQIYTFIYPTPANIPEDTKVVHYYAKELQTMGHHVQVTHLHLWFLDDLLKKHNGLHNPIPIEKEYVVEGIPVHYIDCQIVVPHGRYPNVWQRAIIEKMIFNYNLNHAYPDAVYVHFPTVFTGMEGIIPKQIPTVGIFHKTDIITLKQDKTQFLRDYLMKFDVLGHRNPFIGKFIKNEIGRDTVPVLSGIDSSNIAIKPFVEDKAKRKGPLRVIYVGTLIPRKNALTVIQAVKQFPNYTLDIIGKGPDLEKLKNYVGNDKRIHFLGQLPREEVAKKMGLSDVFVMPSSQETYGLVYLEAMGQGCIAVASKNEGMDGIIKDGQNGFLVNAGNVDDVVSILHKVQLMPESEKRRILLAGYDTACAMTDEKMTREYIKIVEKRL